MKTYSEKNFEILSRALKLKAGSELHLYCSSKHDRNVLCSELKKERAYIIESGFIKYATINIYNGYIENLIPIVVLTKRYFLSVHTLDRQAVEEHILRCNKEKSKNAYIYSRTDVF